MSQSNVPWSSVFPLLKTCKKKNHNESLIGQNSGDDDHNI